MQLFAQSALQLQLQRLTRTLELPDVDTGVAIAVAKRNATVAVVSCILTDLKVEICCV